MQKIVSRGSHWFAAHPNRREFLIRQAFYIALGGALYFLLSMLGVRFFEPGLRNVTFRPAVVIPIFFGVLFGPWVGLFTGLVGKALFDKIADWGFYWNGILAYGLIGLAPGFLRLPLERMLLPRNILRAVAGGALGILAGALFFTLTEARFSSLNLPDAIRDYLFPEVLGNLTVIIILLPLLIVAAGWIHQKRKF